MKLFSRMLTRKPTEEEALGKMDLDMDVEPLRRRDDQLMADDSGQVNPTRVKSSRAQSAADDPFDAVASQPIKAREEEPEEADGAGWGDNAFASDQDWDDDEDWGEDEDLVAGLDEGTPEGLVSDIRGAVSSMSHVAADDIGAPVSSARTAAVQKDWANDEDFGRRAVARSRIGSQVEGAEDRLMSETNSKFSDTESTRRRSALAHLKRAAAATKADKVLSHVAKRDPTLDPDEQSPYRDDLAKVVRPRSGSRPISRPVSKSPSVEEPWDAGEGDDDAAMFAAASERSLLAESASDPFGDDDSFDPLAHVPDNLSAEDFAGGSDDDSDDEEVFTGNYHDEYEADGIERTPMSRPSVTGSRIVDPFEAAEAKATSAAMNDADDDGDIGFVPDEEEDFDGPVPSTAVADAIAIANGEMELEDDDEDDADNAAVRRQLEGFGGERSRVVETTSQAAEPENFVNVASAISTVGRSGRSAGRVKTRLLGFQPGDEAEKDIFEAAKEKAGPASTDFPVGWIIVVEGPGRGKCFTLFNGASSIGRGEDQAVRLDFGDNSISRNNHAAVAFDDEEGKFFLGHGGKSNLVRLNGKPVLSTEELNKGDKIRIGETTLRFMPLCGEDFSWNDDKDQDQNADE